MINKQKKKEEEVITDGSVNCYEKNFMHSEKKNHLSFFNLLKVWINCNGFLNFK